MIFIYYLVEKEKKIDDENKLIFAPFHLIVYNHKSIDVNHKNLDFVCSLYYWRTSKIPRKQSRRKCMSTHRMVAVVLIRAK